MSDPTMVYVAVKDFLLDDIQENIQKALAEGVIDRISHGYEVGDSWGKGQDEDWQTYEAGWASSGITIPNFVGIEVGGTWHGVVMFNKEMRRAIKDAKKVMKSLFPHKEVMVIVRGQQV